MNREQVGDSLSSAFFRQYSDLMCGGALKRGLDFSKLLSKTAAATTVSKAQQSTVVYFLLILSFFILDLNVLSGNPSIFAAPVSPPMRH